MVHSNINRQAHYLFIDSRRARRRRRLFDGRALLFNVIVAVAVAHLLIDSVSLSRSLQINKELLCQLPGNCLGLICAGQPSAGTA
jgi:hypothetical protein